MAYYVNLFSPETYEAFSRSQRNLTGFRISQKVTAEKVRPGDKLICYMTKFSRWVGVLEVISETYEDHTPFFFEENDPYVVRFDVQPLVWLDRDHTIPFHDDRIWYQLSLTRDLPKNSLGWTGMIRRSLNRLILEDGIFLEQSLYEQANNPEAFPIDDAEYEKQLMHRVRRSDKTVTVSIPEDGDENGSSSPVVLEETRESIQMQALIASIGAKMGFKIWIPRNDRSRVLAEWSGPDEAVLNQLPLNYDDTTLKTIKQIDVIWLKGRSIARAFEVEHTTSIYSGILRMADLLALQPNMDIKLHIVAPYARRDKVLQEIRRPVFALLEKGPLYESCTFISYDSLTEMSQLSHLAHMSDGVLDEYTEEAE